ncbi:hypothetical protein CKAH01_01997 [Colletotrichum kahawae]|uniref:Uncharacterized protein n=1 Tax=Colletotrichum kahawae TaxID=34407 RepID=A0AAD9Y2N4_COLKA|nr:hypothetical protein CKAH01_01997 [Colletotrichum kahawae]
MSSFTSVPFIPSFSQPPRVPATASSAPWVESSSTYARSATFQLATAASTEPSCL